MCKSTIFQRLNDLKINRKYRRPGAWAPVYRSMVDHNHNGSVDLIWAIGVRSDGAWHSDRNLVAGSAGRRWRTAGVSRSQARKLGFSPRIVEKREKVVGILTSVLLGLGDGWRWLATTTGNVRSPTASGRRSWSSLHIAPVRQETECRVGPRWRVGEDWGGVLAVVDGVG